jgi:hypothetical protein
MKFEIVHTFKNVTVDQYIKLFFDDAFNDALRATASLKSREVLEKKEENGKLYRKVRVVPGVELPAAVKPLLKGGELSYLEITTMDFAKKVQSFETQVNITDKVKISGEVHFLPAPGGGVLRKLFFDVSASIFGLSGIIEKSTRDQMLQTYDKIAVFTQKWIDDGKAAAFA